MTSGFHHSFRILALVIAAGLAPALMAKNADEQFARDQLSLKLLRLSRSLEMKETSFSDSRSGGSKETNSNDGNSYPGESAFHTRTSSTCQEWIGTHCQKWLDPYISEHGFTSDKSPLEEVVAQEWFKKKAAKQSPDTYAIWKVERTDGLQGAPLDVDGKLDRRGLSKLEILPDVQEKIKKVGDNIAIKAVGLTYDDNASKNDGKTMPNMESLRLMAQRWTKMFRNRLLANVGELRANDPGIEFALDEQKYNCDQYEAALDTEGERTGTQERLENQPRLNAVTIGATRSQRLQRCKMIRAVSANMVNPTIDGDQVKQGSTEDEQVDKWRSRVNLALIDRVGTDPNTVAKPEKVEITKPEYSVELNEFASDGSSAKKLTMTNEEQLKSYNRSLASAAEGMKGAAARSRFIRDTSKQIESFKIEAGSVNMVQLNGLTAEMKGELKDTDFAKTASGGGGDVHPEQNLEDTPAQLTVTRTP